MADSFTIRADALTRAIEDIALAGGSTPYEAGQVAQSLVEANLRGHDSHGVGMMPRYVSSMQEGGLTINQHPVIRFDGGAMVAIDGGRGYGQVIGRESMAIAIERARTHGCCIMALANAHHLGRIGQWAEQAVAEGLVSLHFVNVLSRPTVAAWGGGDGRMGTNPCCIGIPVGGEPPFVLDFATSVVAQGKMRVAYNKGEQVPPGRLIDDQGRPTTDPRYVVVEPLGALMPFGEHKGYGLSLVCELLGGALTGGGTWHRPWRGELPVRDGRLSPANHPGGPGDPGALLAGRIAGQERHADDRHRSGAAGHRGRVLRRDAGIPRLAAADAGRTGLRPGADRRRAGARVARAAAARRHSGRCDHLGADRRGRREGRPAGGADELGCRSGLRRAGDTQRRRAAPDPATARPLRGADGPRRAVRPRQRVRNTPIRSFIISVVPSA